MTTMQLSAMPQTPSQASTATILLAEDEAALRALVKRVLVRAGFRVYEAENGMDAAAVWDIHSNEIDLILTDVVMPLLCGRGLVARVTTTHPHTKVLFMSGYPGDIDSPQGIEITSVNFLEKPFSPATLVARINEALFA